jgi:hypothetical protein
LRKFSVFEGFANMELEIVRKSIEKISEKRDFVIFNEGDECNYIYLIISGEV